MLASGGLQSPLLLLLPFPLLFLSFTLRPLGWYAALALTGAILAGAEAIGEPPGALELGVLAAALLLLAWAPRSLRALSGAVPAAPAPAPELPPHAPEPALRAAEEELHQQLRYLRQWSAAAGVVLWQCGERWVRPLVAAGRTLPGSLPAAGEPLAWVAREDTPLWLEPAPHWTEPGRSVAAARVRGSDDVAWVVTFEYEAAAARPTHEELAAWLGPLRVTFELVSAQQEAVAGQERLGRLLALLRRIPVEIELPAFGQELLRAAATLTGATGGTIATWNGEFGEVVTTVGDDGGPAAGARFMPPHSELGLAIRAGAPITREAGQWRASVIPVVNRDDDWHARPRALVAIPLATPSGTVGVLALWSSEAHRFDEPALELLSAVLPYAALHLDHAREYGRLRERADRDGLTGLRNRRAFEAAFLAERLRFERYGRNMGLLMVDLDHFKSINDEFGHEAGDEVLATVARTIEHAVREVDIPARFGGEEFIVLLPETPLAAAAEVAERVRAAVERTPVHVAGRRLAIRVSIGVSACPERADTPQALLGSADAALYEAKRAGRNRVVAAVAGQVGR